MIKLDPNFSTIVTRSMGTTSTRVVTDTMMVSYFGVDFVNQTLFAIVQRGTLDNNGALVPNMEPIKLTIKADGSYSSEDGAWSGSLRNEGQALAASLKVELDQFIISSGLVGTSAME